MFQVIRRKGAPPPFRRLSFATKINSSADIAWSGAKTQNGELGPKDTARRPTTGGDITAPSSPTDRRSASSGCVRRMGLRYSHKVRELYVC